MKQMTEAQIVARMKQIRESRQFHHVRKSSGEKRENVYESTMVVRSGRKLTGSYKTTQQVMAAYEAEEWSGLENGSRMFEAGKGTRYTKRVHVNKGAHYTKKGVSTTNRPTAHGEAGSVGRIITTKRFSGSRLTCVCKSTRY